MPLETSTPEPAKAGISLSIQFGVSLVLCAFVAIAWRAVSLAAEYGSWEPIVDFHAFYVSGMFVREGLVNDAYNLTRMYEAQRAFAGTTSFMPWTYPPPFNLAVGLLATLPFVLSYSLFVSVTFAAYALVLYRLCPATFATALWTAVPTSLVMIICGQNGFLTAALIGLFAILYLRSSPWAGVVLGLMIIWE